MKNYITRLIRKIFSWDNPYDSISLCPTNFTINILEKSYIADDKFPKYSCILPVLNEEKTIEATLQSLEIQNPRADEVIIVDGGSSDATIAKITEYKKHSKLWIKVLISPIKCNIGYQRNIAIDHAKNELLMNVDAGTILDDHYAANMLGAFLEYKDTDLVCGVHYPKTKYLWSSLFSKQQHFVGRSEPYGACLLYKKSIAKKIGKYPEYLTYAGEDTFFIYKYKKLSKNWVFNKAAHLLWEHPSTIRAMLKKKLNYARAKFEIGLWNYFYYKKFHNPIMEAVIRWSPINLFYKRFLKQQAYIEINKRHIKGLCFIFADYRIDDKRAKKLCNFVIKKIRDNHKVFFINYNIEHRSSDTKTHFINLDHSLLELGSYKNFSLQSICERYGKFLDNSVFILTCKNINDQKIVTLKEAYSNIEILYGLGDE